MDILLDTHCWLWWLTTPERLGTAAREQIENPDNQVFLSAASSREIAIKYALGKLALPEVPSRFVPSRLSRDSIQSLPIEQSHALQVAVLPHHHRDPFDRLLIAQAQLERLCFVTADPQIRAYDVDLLFVG